VLATVKSFLGSRGVLAEHVVGTGGNQTARNLYLLLNDPVIRDGVVATAAPVKGTHEPVIRAWAHTQIVGGGPSRSSGCRMWSQLYAQQLDRRPTRDNPVLVTMKVLESAGLLASDVDNVIGPT
jgi:hypothetical protein